MNNPDLPYRQALERLSQKQYYNFTEVRRLLTEAASADHPAAAFKLAKHLMNADSPHQDREQGMEMLRIAAEQGHPYARYNLAYIQELEGAPPETLIPLYRPLAEAGLPEAQVRLMYLLYASRHFEEALEWAKQAQKTTIPAGNTCSPNTAGTARRRILKRRTCSTAKRRHKACRKHIGNSGCNTVSDKGRKPTRHRPSIICAPPRNKDTFPPTPRLPNSSYLRLPMKPFTGSNRRHRKMTPMPMPHWPTSTCKASIWKETTNLPCIMPKQPPPNAIPKVCGYRATSAATVWA